ncbi:MFS transporter [Streptomyces sp. NPDC059153]|uniref:MFS transporter n=1 Tax=Streptomyces sp. NPDC059153 TaxID=3346743 RepID=UPI0036BEC181
MTSCAEPPSTSSSSTSLWRHHDFRRYLTGQTASVAGTSITQMALPVLAVLHLDATTAQVAWLTFLGQLPPALLALHGGALADRYSKRRQMIAGDLVSAAVLVTVPVSAALGAMTLSQLMIVAVVQGAASVLHDAAAISLLPSLVDRSLIQRSNSRVGALFAIAATAVSHLGAALTAVLGPARAMIGDVASYLISAGCTARIQAREPARARPDARRLGEEIGEGLRYVRGDERLLTLTLVNATTSFTLGLLNTLWALYLFHRPAASPTAFGVIMGVGGVGSLAGALLAPRIASRIGIGPTIIIGFAVSPLAQVPLLLAGPGRGWQIALAGTLAVQLFWATAAGVSQRSLRQILCDPRFQGRMQAASTTVTAGALAILLDVRTVLAVGAILRTIPVLLLLASPVRALRTMPNPPDTKAVPQAREGSL